MRGHTKFLNSATFKFPMLSMPNSARRFFKETVVEVLRQKSALSLREFDVLCAIDSLLAHVRFGRLSSSWNLQW